MGLTPEQLRRKLDDLLDQADDGAMLVGWVVVWETREPGEPPGLHRMASETTTAWGRSGMLWDALHGDGWEDGEG